MASLVFKSKMPLSWRKKINDEYNLATITYTADYTADFKFRTAQRENKLIMWGITWQQQSRSSKYC